MSRADPLNALALALALATALGAVGIAGGRPASPPPATPAGDPGLVTLADGRRALRDAGGVAVALGDYRRIASASLAADALLVELCEPERVLAFSSFATGAYAYRLGAKPRLKGLDDLEAIAALHPDLVLCSSFGGEADRLARLRGAGLTVFDLGDQAGVATLVANAHALGALLGAPSRAERFAAGLQRRLAAVAARLPRGQPRRRAVYVELYGDALSGGTTGSSYHDVLDAAGLDDVAAARYHGWPQYRSEEFIALDPELIVTVRGMGERLRRLPGFAAMRALQRPDGVIELDGALLSDPGPAMLDAAEELFAAAYPQYAGTR